MGKIATNVNNKPIEQPDKAQALRKYITTMKPAIERALPSVLTPDRFTRIVASAISNNPKLADTTPESFVGAMMTAAQLGVEPNTPLGQAYLIPYYNNNKRVMECQFQLGYKGLIDLAYRSGQVTTIQAHVVYANDRFNFSFGLEPKLEHVPTTGKRGDPVYVYAVFKTKDGGFGFEVMSIDDVRAHAQKYSKSFNNGPWQTNFEEMAKKTVLKAALKYAPLKSEFARGLATDETVKTEIAEDMTEVPNTIVIEADSTDVTVDTVTGEVIEESEN